MSGLHTDTSELTEDGFHVVLSQLAAANVGAAYVLFDMAIALVMDSRMTDIRVVGRPPVPRLVNIENNQLEHLVKAQRALPKVGVAVSADWVQWASSTNDNWRWLMARYEKVARKYALRFNREPPWSKEMRNLWMYGPRPRSAGLTPFPSEPC